MKAMSNTVKNAALGWISVRHLQHMIVKGSLSGRRVEAILEEAGVDKGNLADVDGSVPLSVVEMMLQAVSARFNDPLLGLHLASDIQPAAFGAIGLIAQTCATFGEVLDVVVRFNGLLSNIGNTSLRHGPGTVEICWQCTVGGELFRRVASEYVLGALVVMARLLLSEKPDILLSANFCHARPNDTDLVREYFSFFQCPVHFDKPIASLVVPASFLNIPMRHGDTFTKEVLEQHARQLMSQRENRRSLTENVRRLVSAMWIDGPPSKEQVAAQLGISGRSLHRRLKEEGSGFQEILSDLRFQDTCQQLRETSLPVTAIAEQIGFHSQQAFMRWFKQKTGITPGNYRKSGVGR